MKNTNYYRLYFGDLHFHTHYSDNRDRASIEEMILEGTKWNLSIFGTADHNHNLDARKWRQTREETEILRKKYPNFLIINNVEKDVACPVHMLDRVKGIRYDESKPFKERIYQIFV